MIRDKHILILGGTGSLGHELTANFGSTNNIGIMSRDENKQWIMKREYPNARFFIGDVRDKASMTRAIKRFLPEIIIFAAAQKHIDICENEVSESINTNILGIRNLIELLESAEFEYLKTVLFISTDKACNPVNVYGQCKSISEKLMVGASKTIPKIKFVCVRYGNVINSRGSLIPLFKEIANDPTKKFFPVTARGMTRFFMSLAQAVNLIETAIVKGNSGEIWTFEAPSLYIDHIARYFSETYDKPISIIGIRPGEKIHEEMYSAWEESRSRKDGLFMVITNEYLVTYGEDMGLYSNTFTIADYQEAAKHIASMVQHGTFATC